MKKKLLWLLLPAILAIVLLPRWEGARELPLFRRLSAARMLSAAEKATGEGSVEEWEDRLISQGLPVLDSDPSYPSYLANSQDFIAFCQGNRRAASILRFTESGQLHHLLFLRRGGDIWFYSTGPDPEDGKRVTARLPVYDMALSQQGIFYYRCYPEGDPHYIDYNEIRLKAVPREDYDLLRTYILPVGYQMVNLFLTDWQEGRWDSVGLTDTLEFLYAMKTGQSLPWEGWEGSTSQILVPGELFENTLLTYFSLTAQQLRRLCTYHPETGCYSWRPIHGDQLVTWGYPMCEPELVSSRENPDGTKTLEIQVYSPDKRGALMFSHEVTLRVQDGSFQYVGNRVTFVSDYGLPVTLPRFQLDGP